MPASTPASIDDLRQLLSEHLYIADDGLATAVYLALKLRRPLLLEGEAGVGKTEVAKVLSAALDAELIRLQCYEGLDVTHAVYEWNYARQLIEIRLAEAARAGDEAGRPGSGSEAARAASAGAGAGDDDATGERAARVRELFGPDFLIERPLLRALRDGRPRPPVLLIDELDRADEEFEGYLLELLSDFQITIPEIGTIRAATPPVVVITSNRTRELHDALKRRCVFAWIDYPSFQKELRIIATKVPEAPAQLAEQVTGFVQELRKADLYKVTGVSETLDWVAALVALDRQELDAETIDRTLGIVLKTQEDLQAVRGERIQQMLNRAKTPGARAAGSDAPALR
ncbi:MAG: MoxR family ATPase [Acidobacteria bacterium]|nr:MoxR family ATPase [Acidobacteriota bacterium]